VPAIPPREQRDCGVIEPRGVTIRERDCPDSRRSRRGRVG